MHMVYCYVMSIRHAIYYNGIKSSAYMEITFIDGLYALLDNSLQIAQERLDHANKKKDWFHHSNDISSVDDNSPACYDYKL